MDTCVLTTHLQNKNIPVPQKVACAPPLMLSLPLPTEGHWYLEFCIRCFLAHLYRLVTLSVRVLSEEPQLL